MSFFSSKSTSTSGDIIGIASFFDFLCAVFSRIAYTEDPMPLFLISGVFRIIPKPLLMPLSKITNISQLNQYEEIIFNLRTTSSSVLLEASSTLPTMKSLGVPYALPNGIFTNWPTMKNCGRVPVAPIVKTWVRAAVVAS